MPFEHLRAVLDQVDALAQRFHAAGHRLYLVGGIVRDQWLDHPLQASSDIDLTTDALPAVTKQIIDGWADVVWTQGEKFGTIGMRVDGETYEITTHRAESYQGDSRKPEVTFGTDITLDLSRRDFTINAMAIDVHEGELVDPWGGADDLEAGRLRTPLSPAISFGDDPLRMLRAARFATKYHLTPDPALAAAASAMVERIRIVAIERIGDETQRLLELADPSIGLQMLVDTGLLAEVLCYSAPQLIATTAPKLDAAVLAAVSVEPDWRVRLAALGASAFGSADDVAAMGRRLRLARDDTRYITRLAQASHQVVQHETPTPDVIRRWACVVTDYSTPVRLARALDPQNPAIDAFEEVLEAVSAHEALGKPDLLSGQEVMAVLDLAPGPEIGQAHDYLMQCYYAQGPLDENVQRDLLRNWWSDRATSV